jgi:hypothetical protein
MRENGLREIKGNEELRHAKAPRPVAHDARKTQSLPGLLPWVFC